MQGTSVLFGQVLTVFGIVVAGTWGATQWTAAQLGYQLRLGAPWFDFFGIPVYHPWRLFEWWYWFEAYAPRVFLKGGAIAATSGAIRLLRRYRHVGLARAAIEARHDLRLGALGELAEIRKAGLTSPAGVFLGSQGSRLPAPRRPRACHGLCADALGQGRRPRRADTPDLAGIRRDPRHQGRELAAHRRLARALLALPAVQSDRSALRRLQPAARGAARRARGARCPEHRRHPGRSRRRAGAAQPLGEDQPRAAGRHDPPRALRGPTTRRCPASPIFSPIPPAPSRRRCIG